MGAAAASVRGGALEGERVECLMCEKCGALDGEDPLSVVKGNCEIAARSLVETVMASRLQP